MKIYVYIFPVFEIEYGRQFNGFESHTPPTFMKTFIEALREKSLLWDAINVLFWVAIPRININMNDCEWYVISYFGNFVTEEKLEGKCNVM